MREEKKEDGRFWIRAPRSSEVYFRLSAATSEEVRVIRAPFRKSKIEATGKKNSRPRDFFCTRTRVHSFNPEED